MRKNAFIISEVILILLVVLCCVSYLMNPFYIAGLYNLGHLWGWFALLMIVSKIGVFFAALMQTYVFIRCLFKKTWLYSIISLPFILAFFWCFLNLRFEGPYADHYMRGFQKYISKSEIISELELWLKGYEGTENKKIPTSEYPSFIQKINPRYVYFEPESDCSKYDSISVEWYSYLVSWGITVTSDKELEAEKNAQEYCYYVVPMEPGSYIWLGENK